MSSLLLLACDFCGLEIRFGVALCKHIFSRLQRSSALKSVPGVPLRSTPGFSPVAPSALKITASLS